MIYRAIVMSAALALLSACQAGDTPDQQAGSKAAGPAAQPDAPANGDDVPVAAAVAPSAPPPTASDASKPAPSSDKEPALAAYVGKYPFDKVRDVAWVDHPVVQAVIRKSVSDPAVRKTILGKAGTADPVVNQNGQIRSWICEPHNCGGHNWTVLIDPATGQGDVCYYDATVSDDNARWFLAGGKAEMRRGDCGGQ